MKAIYGVWDTGDHGYDAEKLADFETANNYDGIVEVNLTDKKFVGSAEIHERSIVQRVCAAYRMGANIITI